MQAAVGSSADRQSLAEIEEGVVEERLSDAQPGTPRRSPAVRRLRHLVLEQHEARRRPIERTHEIGHTVERRCVLETHRRRVPGQLEQRLLHCRHRGERRAADGIADEPERCTSMCCRWSSRLLEVHQIAKLNQAVGTAERIHSGGRASPATVCGTSPERSSARQPPPPPAARSGHHRSRGHRR